MILPKNWSEERKRATSVWCMGVIFIGLLAFGGYSVYSTIFNPFKISPENQRLAAQFRAAIVAQQLQEQQQRQSLMDQFNKSASLQKPTTSEVSVPGLPTPTELRAALKKSGATDAPQIRDLLLKNGMSKADLDKMDDKTLQATFQQVLTEQIAAQSAAANNTQK